MKRRHHLLNSYDFGVPSTSPEIVTVKAWNLWDEEVELQAVLEFAFDEHDNKCVIGISYITPVIDAEFIDLKTDVRDYLELILGYKHVKI